MRQKEIMVPHGAIRKLSNDLNVAHTTVRSAIRGVTDTKLSQTIRKRALDFYGGVIAR